MAKSFYQIIVSLEGDKNVNKGLQDIGINAGIATAALGAITFKAREAAMAYDAALNKFNTIANETTGTINEQKKAFSDLTDTLKNGITATEALNAGYEVLSSGYQNLSDVTGILEVSQKAAVGGFSDLTTVADAVTTVLNVYGDTYGEAATVTEKANDILSQAITVQNLGKITVDQYARSIGVLAPTARAAGVELADLNGVIALTTSRGIQAETAIRGYRQLLVNLIRPTAQASEAAKAAGINIGAQALATEGYDTILKKIIATAKENPNIVSQIFTDVDSLNIANVLANNSELLEKFVNEAKIAAQKGVLESQFELVSETDVEKQKRLLNLINEAFVDLGTGVVNSLEPLIEAVSAALQAFKNAPDSVKQFAGSLAVILVAAGGFTTSMIAGRAALLSFNEALKIVGVTSTNIALSLGAVAAAGVVLNNIANSISVVNSAASSTKNGIKGLEEALEEFNNAVAENGTEEEKFDAIAFSIERTNQAIQESINPFNKFADSVITLLNNVGATVNGLIDRIPLVPKAIKEALKNIAASAVPLANLIPRDEKGELATNAKAAATAIQTELNKALELSAETRNKFALFDFENASLEEIRTGLAALTAAKDALNKARFTNPEDAAEIQREKLLLDEQIKAVSKLAEARGLAVQSNIETKAAVEQQAQAEKRLNDELTKSLSLLQAKATAELKEIDILKAKGQISDVEAIEQSAAVEEKLNADKRAALEEALQNQAIQGEARAKLEADLAQLIVETEANAAERIVQINKAKLDTIASIRERDIAQIEASGKNELEIAREINQVRIDSAKKEADEINRQLANTKAGSSQRIELETRLFKLQAEIAKSKEELAKKEIAAVEELIKKKLESVTTEERLAKAQAGDDPVAKAEAELKATEKRLQVLKEIAQTQGLSDETVSKLQVDIAETEAKRVELNKSISEEIINRQVVGIQGQLSLQEQLIQFERARVSAAEDFIGAQNSLISTISSGLSSVVSPIEALKTAYERAGSASEALAQFDRDRADALRLQRLADIRVPQGASDALRAQIEAENRRRAAQREAIARQREQEELDRRRAELVRAEAKEREELAKKEREAAVAIRQRNILQQELAKLGIQLNSTGDIANDIKEAQIQLQILELDNQRQLNALKLEQQRLELKNLQLQQQAIISEERLRLESGTLNAQEAAAAQLRLTLAQNQLSVTKQQEANLQRVANLENQGLALQQRLAQAQLSNPAQSAALRPSQDVALDRASDQGLAMARPITDALSKIGTAEQITNAISRLEAVSGNILSATQQLPGQLARVIPKPVIPR